MLLDGQQQSAPRARVEAMAILAILEMPRRAALERATLPVEPRVQHLVVGIRTPEHHLCALEAEHIEGGVRAKGHIADERPRTGDRRTWQRDEGASGGGFAGCDACGP